MRYYKVIAKKDCPFCIKTALLLRERREQFEFCDLDCSPDLLKEYKRYYNQSTVPIIILIDEEKGSRMVIGGFSDLVDYFHRKDLEGNQ
jgi:glutaredoxin